MHYRDNFTRPIWLVANVHPHLKKPDEEGPFKCEEPGCEQTFKCQSTFSSHKLKHTGEDSSILMFVINPKGTFVGQVISEDVIF